MNSKINSEKHSNTKPDSEDIPQSELSSEEQAKINMVREWITSNIKPNEKQPIHNANEGYETITVNFLSKTAVERLKSKSSRNK